MKHLLKTLSLCLLMGSIIQTAQADIKLLDDLWLTGDMRFRYDLDTRSGTGINSTNDSRERPRLRLRYGAIYNSAKHWKMGLRFRTESDNNNSPHRNLGVSSAALNGRNSALGLDQAYIKATWLKHGYTWLGKNDMPIWQLTEIFWDKDIQPEGLAAGYTFMDRLTLNAGYFYLNNEDWQSVWFNNDTFIVSQLLYHPSWGKFDTKFNVTGSTIKNRGNKSGTFDTRYFYVFGGKVKYKGWPVNLKVGGDFYYSSEESGATNSNQGFAFVAGARWKKWGLRTSYYDVGESSTPFVGTTLAGASTTTTLFTQDDFPSTNSAAVGYTGQHFSLKYNISETVNVDANVYLLKAKTGNKFKFSETLDMNRFQLNLNARI
jgi:hypothetical protein